MGLAKQLAGKKAGIKSNAKPRPRPKYGKKANPEMYDERGCLKTRPPWLKPEWDFSGNNQPDPATKRWKELDLRRNIRSLVPQAITNIMGFAVGYDPLGRIARSNEVLAANQWLVENGYGKVGERLAILVASLDKDGTPDDPNDPDYNPATTRKVLTPAQKLEYIRNLMIAATEVQGLPKTSKLLLGVQDGGNAQSGEAEEAQVIETTATSTNGNGNGNGSGGH